jgi:hypothetical protein
MAQTAGSIFPVLDYLLTEGSNPWTKSTIGTNHFRYTAPGGSQIGLDVLNNSATTASLYARLRGVVSGQTFPTPAQEATTNEGHLGVRTGYTTTINAANQYGWYGWRTDRFMMLLLHNATQGTANSGLMAAGDLPVYDPADAGLCVVIGTELSSTYPTTSSLSPFTQISAVTSSAAQCGYSYTTKTGLILSAPIYARRRGPSYLGTLTVEQLDNSVPLLPFDIFSSSTNLESAATGMVLRGWLPWIYPIQLAGVTYNAQTTTPGDVFSIGDDDFEFFAVDDYQYAVALTDYEDLP